MDESKAKMLNNPVSFCLNSYSDAIRVECRVVFLSIHDIDTSNEKFTAELYIESRWNIAHEFDSHGHIETLPENWKPKWSPQISIDNIISEIKSETWYKITEEKGLKYINELKRIKGAFYEKLELEKYPFDVQNLNITMISNHSASKCILTSQASKLSTIVSEGFRDIQEWYLYDLVGCEENQISQSGYSADNEKHSKIVFFSAVARRPTYFYWNAFFMIFIINTLSFNMFSIPFTSVGQRLQTTVTLILTLVSFKWVINRNLPPIAYLTFLDLYSILSIFFISVTLTWHAIVGYFHETFSKDADKIFLTTSGIIYIMYHCFIITHHYINNYGPRRKYQKLEQIYQEDLARLTNKKSILPF